MANLFGWLGDAVSAAFGRVVFGGGGTTEELARRLGVATLPTAAEVPRAYRWFRRDKARGGSRLVHAPKPPLKALQRKVLRKLLGKLKTHPAAKGFRKGESIVTHARLHAGKAVVIKLDIKDFFPRTTHLRVMRWFRRIGWNARAAGWLAQVCCHQGRLPQGAPTSPALSNLVNCQMDARLAGLAQRSGMAYSRYADDIAFSGDRDDARFLRGVVRRVRRILHAFGYRLNQEKLRVLRRHNRQQLCGLVVNAKPQLPRAQRRLLRAVGHRLATRPFDATMTRQEFAGWQAYQAMVVKQAAAR